MKSNPTTAALITALTLTLLLLITGCPPQDPPPGTIIEYIENPQPQESAPSQEPIDLTGKEVTITTPDGLSISATLYHSTADKAVILLHMLGRDSGTWEPLLPDLASRYAVLAIDLRGHGKSQGDRSSFTEKDYKNMASDLQAARKILPQKDIAIIGASIGANTALRYAVGDTSVKTLVLLSPGLDYRGVKTPDAMRLYNRPILLATSTGDTYSYNSVKELSKIQPHAATEYLEGDQHGTDLLHQGTVLKKHIIKWLDANLG